MSRRAANRLGPDAIDADGAASAVAAAAERGNDVSNTHVRDVFAWLGAGAPGVLGAASCVPTAIARIAREIETASVAASAETMPRVECSGLDASAAMRSLRAYRHEGLVRTVLRELRGWADVERSAREWSHVARTCMSAALRFARHLTAERDAEATAPGGTKIPISVLGMGKLGGAELNLGSDIDVCFFYGSDEGQAGERTVHEFMVRVASLATRLLDEVTDAGFAYRVDLRLRPEGSRGPLANSLASAERYYETWGRTWERAALVRAAPIAGETDFGEELLAALRPFVFRRAVNPGISREMQSMLARARREQLQDDAHDLKLGTGGIREAEFFVQSLQLIWGGHQPSLQVPGTAAALSKLRAHGLVSDREARTFANAWALLRRVEHRVQMATSFETHVVPSDPAEVARIARSLGYASAGAMLSAIRAARDVVRALTATLEPAPDVTRAGSTPPEAAVVRLADIVARGAGHDEIAESARDALQVRTPEIAAEDLRRLARRADLPLGAVTRERDPLLGPRLLAEVRDAPDPDRALGHLADLFASLRGQQAYARRLGERGDLARALIGLLGTSDALARSLIARPDLVDAVVAGGVGAPRSEQIAGLVRDAVRAAIEASQNDENIDPTESVVAALRRVQRDVVLEVGLADISGELSAGEVARRISTLASACVASAFERAANDLAKTYGRRHDAASDLDGIAVFALGSLAANELGYAGDLDFIVLHDGRGETSGAVRAGVAFGEFAARVAQRAIVYLSSPSAEGPGWVVDTRLRPSGSQGTLVVSVDGFRNYHDASQEGAHASWWERQALIRCRWIAGDAALAESATRTIRAIAYESGAPDLREVRRIRERVELEIANETPTKISIKHGRGGLVDLEYAAQCLQMKHGSVLALRTPTTRAALAALRDAAVLGDGEASTMLAAERLLRRAYLAARLITGEGIIVARTPSCAAVARKLGYRDLGHASADEALWADLANARDAVRAAFERIMTADGNGETATD